MFKQSSGSGKKIKSKSRGCEFFGTCSPDLLPGGRKKSQGNGENGKEGEDTAKPPKE